MFLLSTLGDALRLFEIVFALPKSFLMTRRGKKPKQKMYCQRAEGLTGYLNAPEAMVIIETTLIVP